MAGAICAATTSNIIGIVLSPILLAALLHMHGAAMDLGGLWKIMLELLLPFVLGHALRPWIGDSAERNRALLAVTDRGSILVVVYTAFSAAVINGIWHRVPMSVLAELLVFDLLLLAGSLVVIRLGSRAAALPRGDEVTTVFCGSQKSIVTGVPMAQLLFSASAAGMIVLRSCSTTCCNCWLAPG